MVLLLVLLPVSSCLYSYVQRCQPLRDAFAGFEGCETCLILWITLDRHALSAADSHVALLWLTVDAFHFCNECYRLPMGCLFSKCCCF